MEIITDKYAIYQGDCVQLIRQIPDNSIHLSVFSPPFANLYIYSDNLADMGNCKDSKEFFKQFDYLIPELLRVTIPGRLCAVHCKQLVKYKGRDGRSGLYDFRGDIIRHFENAGWQYHSEVQIWTDPVLEMQKTKSQGLLYKQLRKDSSYSRQGLPDYIVAFRKWTDEYEDKEAITKTKESFPLEKWQKYASPCWFDIKRTDVLNGYKGAGDSEDEKHICPLQLETIKRVVELWSNPNDTVLTPFGGIGSEVYQSILSGRKGVGFEIKESYFYEMAKNCANAVNLLEEDEKQISIFDV